MISHIGTETRPKLF